MTNLRTIIGKVKNRFFDSAGDHDAAEEEFPYQDIDSLNDALLSGLVTLDEFIDNQRYIMNRESRRQMKMDPPGRMHEHI